MLTVIIETKNCEEALARTLGPLVSGAVDGLLRDVIVQDCGSSDHTAKVAEQAGCVFTSSCSLAECIHRARGEWLLFLEPGARLSEGWIESVERHMSMVQSPAKFTRSRAGQPSFLSRIVKRETALADGLLITKRQALALMRNAKSGEALARGLAVRRMNAEIVLAGR
jgi:glycosyltransferase involved in cell wall biosynthesis